MFSKFRRLSSYLIGDFHWQPPGWLSRLVLAAVSWVRSHRRATLLGLLVIAALAAGSWRTWDWYQHRPKPVTISVKVDPPGVTPPGKELKPRPLVIHFGGSVARLEQMTWVSLQLSGPATRSTPAPISQGIRMDPPVEGRWHWANDHQLVFEPKLDWPADRTYHITFDRTLFPEHVLLEHYTVEAHTPAFIATMSKIEFYTDPTDPTVKQVVATFEFTHRVDMVELEKRLNLAVIGGSEIFKKGVPHFTLTAGLNQRLAYLRTSPLTLPEHEDFLRVTLEKGLPTLQGGVVTSNEVEKKVSVPDIYSFFRIAKSSGTIVRNNEGDPEQVILIESSCAAKSEEIQKALHIYLLPKKRTVKDHEDADNDTWSEGDEIDEGVLQHATVLPFKLLPAGKENSELHSFKVSLETDGQLYVTIDKGVKAMGGFLLGDNYSNILPVPVLPREIEIQGTGGVLALNGEHKLSIKSRGVRTIEYEIARVPADQINHLVSQTRGEFQNPEFVNSHFGPENIARIATEKQSINVKNKFKANYSAFDFTKHLRAAEDGGSPMQGLFFLKAREWHPPKKKPAKDEESVAATDDRPADAQTDEEESDEDEDESAVGDGRFILITDLGMVVKENTDGSRDVFFVSIKTGTPLGGVEVEVLAKNGVPLLKGQTTPDGRVTFPSLGKPTREKAPVAFVARLGNDVAFMPYAREDRQLDFSRFDTGGVESRSGAELDAFVFTERGIYRPGDEIRIGLIVKQRDWAGKLEGLPVETEILDARGTSVQVRKLALPAMGFAETSYQTAYESPTGVYSISVYLVRDGKRGTLLGETSATVKEFLPDRMKIESLLSKETKAGWITPDDVHAAITLRNLYGTPATDRRIKSHLVLSPADFRFEEFAGFNFFDRLHDEKKELKSQDVELGEQKTDEQGVAKVDLQLERFADATYAMTLFTEGFEADGGRSVSTSNSVLVSALPYVIGAKSDGDFNYIKMGDAHAVEWIALDPTLKKIAVGDLEARLIERVYVSVLSKAENGNYVYESVLRENVIRSEAVSISADGLKYPLPTDVPGNYVIELREKNGDARVSQVSFSVVGRGAVTRSLEKDAELQVKLSKPQYNTGDEIEISIVAPYTGSGLITIERDKVYAHTWFKADRTSTVQHIRVPADFEGTGYVNVCFVRALDSKEVFMSPLSYAVEPFKANIEKRRLPISLRAVAKAKPGEPLHIGYKTDRPSRIAIFAVDQGILQVTDYQLPNPLAHFFRKAALMVQTKQIVDLILPEYSILRSASAFGGDGEKHLNPFRRVTEKPVVFWSGVVDADAREHEVIYDVPDYFSGTLTIMAVAVSPDAVGSTEMNSLVRGPFVLTPNVPTVAAPGDQFDVSVTVANGVEGSGENAAVEVKVEPSEHLEIVKSPANPLQISEGREISTTFTVRALEKFGSASLRFRASLGGQESQLRSTLSVRPAVPFMTSVRSGNFTKDAIEVPIERTIHPDFRRLDATVSALPLGLARGLDFYLKNYPNGCSEQITSGAFCRLVLADEADFGLTRNEVHAQMERTFATLRRRQNDQGSFGYWAADNNDRIDFVSTYVMHFLIEAKAAGFAPPQNVFQSGLRHLQAMVVLEPGSLREARIQAYAIYLLTREGVVTTNYILNLRDYLDKSFEKKWAGDLTAVYLAGAYELLKKRDDAQRLIKGYKLGVHDPHEWGDFHSALGADSQYIAILGRHFPDMLKRVTAEDFKTITRPVGEGSFNTLSAAYAVLALKNYSHFLSMNTPQLGMAELAAKKETALRMEGSALLKRATFSANATALRFTARNPMKGMGAFYQVVEAGYDAALPTQPVADGLEIFREFVDAKGAVTRTAALGEPITERLRIRSLKGEYTNVAIVDLLPGGFEMAAGSLQPGVNVSGFDYVDVREDRVVFFGTVGPAVREVTYKIKPTNRGEFVVPPTFAESMYDRTVKARALAGKITVTDAP
ncbi:MAG TPA: MG2 domain-containing protein [Chthoniobacter sp.]|nr:MG2 domain-containing protein [Chthoniobacter sp.]